MTWMMLRQGAASALAYSMLVLAAGCGALDVSNPTTLEDQDFNNATGADLSRKAAIRKLAFAAGAGVLAGGLFADEFFTDTELFYVQTGFAPREEVLDRRLRTWGPVYNDQGSPYYQWQEVRRATSVAVPRIRAYMLEPARSAYLGQVLAIRGYAALRLAEDFCAGFPLHDVVDYQLVSGPPLTTVEALERALADFDSAVVYAADSARFLNFARVGRARTLLGLGRFDEAAAAAADVPTSYVWNAEFTTTGGVSQPNPMVFTRTSFNSRRSVADREGGRGLDFVSANDPRVPVGQPLGLAYDGVTEIYATGKYPTTSSPIPLASGIEARLIEAEAALRSGQPQWLTILNTLRQNQVTPALAATTDPGTPAERVDLLFRERAFWLFATGHRLGDLRRLIRQYSRAPETLFPAGPYRLGGAYDTGTGIPFPAEAEAMYSATVTGCTDQ